MASDITIDEAGRVIIPIEIRRRLRLRAGSRLQLVEEDERLVLTPKSSDVIVKEKGGILVLTASAGDEIPDHRDIRHERLNHFAPK